MYNPVTVRDSIKIFLYGIFSGTGGVMVFLVIVITRDNKNLILLSTMAGLVGAGMALVLVGLWLRLKLGNTKRIRQLTAEATQPAQQEAGELSVDPTG